MVRRSGRRPTKTLWVCCEGKTERLYFNKLKFIERISRLKIKSFESGHKNADGLVNEALCCVSQRDFQAGDIIVCVFDRDSNSNPQLAQAKNIAKQKGVLLSFSNPSFEYWVLCHYGYFPSKYEKDSLEAKIKEKNPSYKKADPELYTQTKANIQIAIKNAKTIQKKHIKERTELISKESNPLTLVFLLLELIEKFR